MSATLDRDLVPISNGDGLERLVPPDLPPQIAVARLVALAETLLQENRRLREALETHVAVEEAARILAARLGIPADEADRLLRPGRTNPTSIRVSPEEPAFPPEAA